MSITIKGGTSVDLVGVTTDKECQTRASLFSENSTTADPAGRILRSPETSRDYRLRVGRDQLLFQQSWENASNVNLYQNQYKFQNATATQALVTGYHQLNNGSSVTFAQYAQCVTYRSFPAFGSYPLYAEFTARTTNENALRKLLEFGVGIPPAGTTAITDGVYFQFDDNGEFHCVLNYNGTLTRSASLTIPSTGDWHRFIITVFNEECEFWVDDALVAKITVPGNQPLASCTYQLPAFWRVANNHASINASAAAKLDMGMIAVHLGDMDSDKPWPFILAGAGLGAYQIPVGALASGPINVWANSAEPTAITALSNTALPTGPTHTNRLGGLFLCNLAAFSTAVADFIMWGFPNPAGTATSPGRALYITGVRVMGMLDPVTAGVTGSATDLWWGLGVGSTALSLATTDAVAAKAPRRIPIGCWFLPAAAGATAGLQFPTLDLQLPTPVVVNPGEHAHIIIRVGTALTAFTAGNIRGAVTVNGFFE